VTQKNRQWLLRRRPSAVVQPADFEYRETEIPAADALRPGEILLRNRMFVCAPTMRNWMDGAANALYPTMRLGDPVLAPAGGEVVASANPLIPAGSRVTTFGSWQDYQVIGAEQPVAALPEGTGFIEALGVLGFNSLTGYFGLLKVGMPKPGQTLVVSGAAGSTGSIAAQIGRIKGCRVIGIAGGAEKCAWLVKECRLDAAIDYRSGNLYERLKQLCPNGIDIFFDNVGGEVLQAAVDNMARFGKIVLCGQIAGYNSGAPIEGPRNMMRIIYGSITLQGFLVGNYASEAGAALEELRTWMASGEIVHREDVRYGFDAIPATFAALFDGTNRGTLLAAIE
jgi:NADPH-dependent curcumin reductase CurA